MSRRWVLFGVGLAASLLITAALWAMGLPGFFLFLFFPFLFFPWRRDTIAAPARCPACATPAGPGDRFCRRCGTDLQRGG